jgi:hypothetical protein
MGVEYLYTIHLQSPSGHSEVNQAFPCHREGLVHGSLYTQLVSCNGDCQYVFMASSWLQFQNE